MKSLGWPFLALLVAVQLIGWLCYGRAAACQALILIVVPASLIIGMALFWAFYWNRLWLPCMPVALILVHIGVVSSDRTKPGSALLCHALDEFLGQRLGGWEVLLADSLLFFSMVLLASATAFCTAEIYRIGTGRRERGGIAFSRDILRDFAIWEKAVAKEQDK